MGRAGVILVEMINTRLCPAPGLHLYARLSGDQPPDLSPPLHRTSSGRAKQSSAAVIVMLYNVSDLLCHNVDYLNGL